MSKKLTEQVPALTVKSCGKLQQNVTPGYQYSSKKLCEFSLTRWEVKNFKFHWLVLSKRSIAWAKILTQQVPALTVKSCGKFQQNLTPGFKFSTKKMAEFFKAGEKVKISNFIGCFCLKDKLTEQKIYTASSCSDSKELWKGSEKSKPWFPIQHKKIGWIFLEQARRSKFQISLVGFL